MSTTKLPVHATVAVRPLLLLLNIIKARPRGAGILAGTLLLAAAAGCGGGSDPASSSEADVGSRSRPMSATDRGAERRTATHSGSGSGSGSGNGLGAGGANTSAPAAPALRLALVGTQLRFSWDFASGAAYYQLFANADGASGFTRVGSDFAADRTNATLDIAAHPLDWDRARYLLEACNGTGCTPSNPVATFGIKPPVATSAPGARGRFAQSAAGVGLAQVETGSAAGPRTRFDPRR